MMPPPIPAAPPPPPPPPPIDAPTAPVIKTSEKTSSDASQIAAGQRRGVKSLTINRNYGLSIPI